MALRRFRVSPIFLYGLYESSIATELTQGLLYLLPSLGDSDLPSARCCTSIFSSGTIHKGFVHRTAVSSRYTIRSKEKSVPMVRFDAILSWTNRLTSMTPPTPLTCLRNFAIPAPGAIIVMDAEIVTKFQVSDPSVNIIDCLGISNQRANESLQNTQE